jgi:phage terminase large subunit-like protein
MHSVVTDDAGNRKFTKRKSTGRIDALVALAMAVAVLPAETSSSIYNERGIYWEANA